MARCTSVVIVVQLNSEKKSWRTCAYFFIFDLLNIGRRKELMCVFVCVCVYQRVQWYGNLQWASCYSILKDANILSQRTVYSDCKILHHRQPHHRSIHRYVSFINGSLLYAPVWDFRAWILSILLTALHESLVCHGGWCSGYGVQLLIRSNGLIYARSIS